MQNQKPSAHHQRQLEILTNSSGSCKSVPVKTTEYYVQISPRFVNGLTFVNQIKEVKIHAPKSLSASPRQRLQAAVKKISAPKSHFYG